MYQNLFDSHTHSKNSPDGRCSVSLLAEAAIAKGLRGLAITDHCDCESWERDNLEQAQRQSLEDVAVARQRFGSRLLLSAGVELGQPDRAPQLAERLMRSGDYDFVLLSQHELEGMVEFYYLDYSKLSDSENHAIMLRYLEELLDMCKRWDFDSLAHLSLTVRYPKIHYNIDLDFARYAAEVDEILKVLAHRGKALELNTSGLRNAMRDTLPPMWAVRRFRELGGELITIGSDAHKAADVGVGIQEGMERLAAAGFTHFAFYQRRKPVMQRIF